MVLLFRERRCSIPGTHDLYGLVCTLLTTENFLIEGAIVDGNKTTGLRFEAALMRPIKGGPLLPQPRRILVPPQSPDTRASHFSTEDRSGRNTSASGTSPRRCPMHEKAQDMAYPSPPRFEPGLTLAGAGRGTGRGGSTCRSGTRGRAWTPRRRCNESYIHTCCPWTKPLRNWARRPSRRMWSGGGEVQRQDGPSAPRT